MEYPAAELKGQEPNPRAGNHELTAVMSNGHPLQIITSLGLEHATGALEEQGYLPVWIELLKNPRAPMAGVLFRKAILLHDKVLFLHERADMAQPGPGLLVPQKDVTPLGAVGNG